MVARQAGKEPALTEEYARVRKKFTKIAANLVVARKLVRIAFRMLMRKEEFRGSSPKAALSA